MENNYYNSIVMVEKLHRLFLEVVKCELHKLDIRDINNVQSLVLYNIGERKLSIGDLTAYGYYLGSNVSYNLRKLVENGYVLQVPSPNDRRSSNVSLTEKGLEIYGILGVLFDNHLNNLYEIDVTEEMISNLIETLKGIEKYLNKVEY